jgi:hypothetical protein
MNQKMTGRRGWGRAVRGLTAAAMAAGLLAFGSTAAAAASTAAGCARPVDAACDTSVSALSGSAAALTRFTPSESARSWR